MYETPYELLKIVKKLKVLFRIVSERLQFQNSLEQFRIGKNSLK